ncbi:MAG: hypothetical protein SVS85_00820 [Candidatus Nanohaloarchaea archaeon]|nr:hypothetical protein [Candidatus Nanohaloarchaea archaeon]
MRKGQYTLVEQVVLFALGISITLGFMYAFNSMRRDVGEDLKESQAELVSEYAVSTSIELVESGAEGSITFRIPEEAASQTYALRLGKGGVKFETAGEEELSPLYGLRSTMNLEGEVESTGGFASLALSGDRLTLRRSGQ